MTFDGLLRVAKPIGCTSHDVVADVRRALRQKKVGHCGTLDPMATGLLLVTTGRATRLTRFLIGAPKVYEGTATFGRSTDTYDAQGQTTAEADAGAVTTEAVRRAMEGFVGDYEQVAPPYSAKKVGGRKLYELARSGEEVPERRSTVTIYGLEPRGELQDGVIDFRLSCASGTYARSIVHDLGAALGCGAHLSALQRTAIGPFPLDGAIGQDELHELAGAEDPPDLEGHPAWTAFDEIHLPFATVETDVRGARRIAHGQTVLAPRLDAQEGDWVKITDGRGRFLAVGSVAEKVDGGALGVVQPKIVFR